MDSVKIFWGSDRKFDDATQDLENFLTIGDILNHIGKTEIAIDGIEREGSPPLEVDNLIICTDDYGAMKEWALLGFSNNVLEHQKVNIHNIWLNNPPEKIYTDVCRMYPNKIKESKAEYPNISIDSLKEIFLHYRDAVIGQDNVIVQILSALYALKNVRRKKPVTLLFLGESGVGKTETAKFISEYLGEEMVRVQFSMQQTNNAYQFIFGAEHGENSLARELVRRNSNVVLLDEFDKVHPSFYNAFYQMFDEGIFVDSNYSVNVEKCVIICTTNYTTEEEAEKHLGTPIYSRFSKIIKFGTISIENRIIIAEKNYHEIFTQLDEEDQMFISENQVLKFYIEKIKEGYYKNMRMLRNDIEDAINFEILKARNIIKINPK